MKTRRQILSGLGALLACGAAHSRSLEAIRAGGNRLVVATEGTFPPFNHIQGGKFAGFEVELAELLSTKMTMRIEWKKAPFDALLPGLAKGRWDMVIASHAISPERAKAVTFMAPHYCAGGMIVSRDRAVHAAKDLAGKTVAVQAGTSYASELAKFKGLKAVRDLPTDGDAGNALASGQADAWVTDRFTAIEAAHRNPALKLHLGDLVFRERIAAATAKGNTALADTWNKALESVLADGSYALLAKKFFGEDVRCR